MVSKAFASLANQVEEHSKIPDEGWYVVPIIVGGVVIVLFITVLVIFKFIQKRRQAMSDPETRLSVAYRDGFLREDSGPKWRSESLKRSGRSSNDPTKNNGHSDTSLADDKQQSRRLIGQEGAGSAGCNGSIGYGGVAKENTIWCPIPVDSRRNSGATRSCDSSRLNSPRESKIEIETRGEKSYPTIAERVNREVDFETEDGSMLRPEGRGFLEKCYDEYKSKKDKLTDDERIDSKQVEEIDKNEQDGQLGKLFFEVKYDHERLILSVSIVKAQGLAVSDSILGSCDPYVKLQLLPDKKLKVKTRLVRKNQNPVFDEQFDFYNMEPQQVQKVTLYFSVYSFDRFSRDYVIGEVRYPLGEVMDCWVDTKENRGIKEEKDGDKDDAKDKDEDHLDGSGEIIENSGPECKSFFLQVCQDLLPQSDKVGDQNRGEILLSLCFNPSNCQLIVAILKARNLPQTDIPETIEPYVKIYLKFDGQRLAKKRTTSKCSAPNPVFNETFTFQLPRTPSELAAMLAWNRYNPLVTSTPSSMTSVTRKFNLPCRLQGQICRENESGREPSNRDGKSMPSLFRRFSICSSTLLDKPSNPSDPRLFIPKSPTFAKNSSSSPKRPAHILDRFSLSIFLVDEEQESSSSSSSSSSSEFIGRVELGSFTDYEQTGSSDLVNVLTASEHWSEIINNPKKQIAKWYHLTN